MISTILQIDYREDKQFAVLVSSEIAEVSELVRNFDSDCFVAITLKFLRMVCGPSFNPKKVAITWAPSTEVQQQYFDEFNCDIEFSAEKSAIYLDIETIEDELPTANIALARDSDKAVVDFLAKTASVDIESLVCSKIIEFLPTGNCTRETVAKSLHMSPGTLHKKLSAINSSFKTLLDLICKELAEQYIGTDGLSIGEAAYLLGVTDCSNFSRSFKRWVGMSPSEYRDLHFKG